MGKFELAPANNGNVIELNVIKLKATRLEFLLVANTHRSTAVDLGSCDLYCGFLTGEVRHW
jgi:hypothetical protein